MKDKNTLQAFMRRLSVRIPVLLIISYSVFMVCVLGIVWYRFHHRMLDDYTRMAEGMTQLMAMEVDGDKVDEYIEKNYELPEYRQILDRLEALRANYPDVQFVYVFKVVEDGSIVVMDPDILEDNDPDYQPGSLYPTDAAFAVLTEEIMAGEETPAYEVKSPEDGRLLTYIRPVYDSDGNYACSVCVDFSMAYLYTQDMKFVLMLGLFMLVSTVIVLAIDVHIIRKDVTVPLGRMARCTSKFAYTTEEDRFHNISLLEELNITTGDEIEDLYVVFLATMKEGAYYMANLTRAKNEIKEKEEQINYLGNAALKDAMTGVGNKAAYEEAMGELQTQIDTEEAKFGIVMVDVNNLKYINDTYGHEKGDLYLKGSCRMVCDIYKKSPVFRIGGDEFVVILRGKDYERGQVLYAKLMIAFNNSYKQLKADDWERYTASMGMAEWRPGDRSPDVVFKRADELMYENKKRFKERYGSYR